MPKRKNPFGDSDPRQLKTHIGFKETATNEELQAVYDRTQAMLFRGANPTKVVQDATVLSSCNGEDNGQLKHQPPIRCYYCRRCTGAVISKCWFCERSVCSGCLGTCAGCKQPCCTLCSVMNYDQTDVRFFCLDCVT